MKRIVITGEWLNTLPLPHTRPYMVNRLFELAGEHGWSVDMAGEHWTDGAPTTADVTRVANGKLCRDYQPPSARARQVRHAQLMQRER